MVERMGTQFCYDHPMKDQCTSARQHRRRGLRQAKYRSCGPLATEGECRMVSGVAVYENAWSCLPPVLPPSPSLPSFPLSFRSLPPISGCNETNSCRFDGVPSVVVAASGLLALALAQVHGAVGRGQSGADSMASVRACRRCVIREGLAGCCGVVVEIL